ncbi:MAG: ribosome maturation factor RimP [Gammaproteobacteria bacterium]|nr:ribosome maturation factor RimP [Gammaproteobacteria bacterium]
MLIKHEALKSLIEPQVESLGYELVHLELDTQGGNRVLRIYIDAPGGIQVDDCETVSRQLSLVLDVENPLSMPYLLEVSSPGLDRPLVIQSHFKRFLGRYARIVMENHIMGRKRFKGMICEAGDDSVVVEVDGEQYDLPYEQMVSARLEPDI